jgi:hypothetical protein
MNTPKSLALWAGVSMLIASLCAATVIYLTHPADLHEATLLVRVAAFLWPFIVFPLAWVGCTILTVSAWRRGTVCQALLGLLLATIAWPATFSGYLLNQKPWLSPTRKLQDAWPDVRAHGVWQIGEGGAPEDLPLLIGALRDPISIVRSTAAASLSHYGPKAERAIPVLVITLDDEDWYVGCEAAEALGSMRGLQDRVLPRLVEYLADTKPHRSWCAAKAIRRLGPDGARAVPALVRQLGVEDPNIRSAVCETLGSIGSAAKVAIPELTAALADSNQWVRKAAREALPKVQGK